jgi:hypothetical protein
MNQKKKSKATFTKDFWEKNALKLPDLEDNISEKIATILDNKLE